MAQKPLSAANGEQSQKTTVLVVGAGPVGIFLTLLLARANIPVTLIEARDVLDKDHKAVAQSPVVFPILKHAGILEDVQAAAGELRSTSSSFRRTTDKEIVAEVPKVAGRPGPLILSQGTFSHLLMDHVKKYESAKVLMGHSLQEVDTSSPDTVTAAIKTTDGSLKTISAAYLIGADGGRSRVRNLTGIQFEGITLPHQLIATDVFYPFDTHGFSRGANFMADPEHYGLIAPINSDGLWRVSFSVPNNMKQEEIEAVVPEKFEAMFPGPRPLNYKLDRVAPYKAQQLCAKTFRAGRVLLIGDAAHLTNPYAGLGLTTGLLDASSLAPALAACLLRKASDQLLSAWANARREVYLKFVDPISRSAFWSMQDTDVASIATRHPMLKAAKAGPDAKPPPLTTDVTTLEGWVAA